MSSVPPVRIATAAEQERVIATITLAFSYDPITRWVYPEPSQFLTYFPQIVRHFGGRAFGIGSAYCSEDFRAAALWLPPGVQPDEEGMEQVMKESLSGVHEEQVSAFGYQQAAHHPKEPVWYLPLLGVDPARQGQGYGSALLATSLEKCDADHSDAYLESTNERNLPLYQRYGFEVIGEIQAGDSPTLWPMLRRRR